MTIVIVLSILAVFTTTFIDNAVKTYMLAKKQGNIYQEASYIMERITRELRDAIDIDNASPVNYLYFQKRHGTLMDNKYMPYIYFYLTGDSVNSINRMSYTTTPFFEWGIVRLGINVSQIYVALHNQSTVNERASIVLTRTDGSQSVTLSATISPKNYGYYGTNNYINRCFNGDYEDVIQ